MRLLHLITLILSIACSILPISAMQQQSETKTTHATAEEMTDPNRLLAQAIDDLNITKIQRALDLRADINNEVFGNIAPLVRLCENYKYNYLNKDTQETSIRKNYLQIIQLLLGMPSIQVNCKDAVGRRPLHFVIKDLEFVKLLLAIKTIEIDAQDNWGRTPLYYLIESEGIFPEYKLSILQLLLAHGADPGIQTNDKDSAYNQARKKDQNLFTALEIGRQEYFARKHTLEFVSQATPLNHGICHLINEYLFAATKKEHRDTISEPVQPENESIHSS